jgi:uncharacterized protein (TIGR03083 family)
VSGAGAGAAYAGVRQRINELLDGVEDRTGDTVPACPSWRVHDLVCHVAGVADDVLGGRLEGAGSDPWTAAQVAARCDRSTAEVLAEWNTIGPQLEEGLDSFGPAGHQLVMDTVTHEHDLRNALRAPGDRSSDAVQLGVGWLVAAFQGATGAAVEVVETDGAQRTWPLAGGATPVATVSGSSFDLLRSLSGRRTEAEIRSLSWDGDVDAVLPSFTWGPFRLPAASLGE